MNALLNINQFTTLNALTIAVIATIASALAGVLRQDGLPSWLNEGATAIFLVLAAIVSTLIAGKFSVNLVADITLVSMQVGVLMLGPCKPLEQYMQVHVNISKKPTPPPKNLTPLRTSKVTTAATKPAYPSAASWTPGNHSG